MAAKSVINNIVKTVIVIEVENKGGRGKRGLSRRSYNVTLQKCQEQEGGQQEGGIILTQTSDTTVLKGIECKAKLFMRELLCMGADRTDFFKLIFCIQVCNICT